MSKNLINANLEIRSTQNHFRNSVAEIAKGWDEYWLGKKAMIFGVVFRRSFGSEASLPFPAGNEFAPNKSRLVHCSGTC